MTITGLDDIASCFCWLDADDASQFTFSSGDHISHWVDAISSIDFQPDGGSDPQRSTGILNGRAVVLSGKMRGITVDLAQPQTSAWVFFTNSSGAGNNRVIADGRGGGTAGWEFGLQNGPDRLYIDAGSARGYFGSYTDDTPHYAIAIWDGANSLLRVDGVEVVAPTNVGSNGIDDDLFLMDSRFGNAAMDGYLAEVGYFNDVLDSTEIADVEAYFEAKWFTAGGSTILFGELDTLVDRHVAGSITPAGSIFARTLARVLTGATTPTGALQRSLARALTGTLTSSGTVTTSKVTAQTYTGSITPGPGTLTRQVNRTLDGAVTSSGALARALARTLTGATTPTGALARSLARSLTGGVTSSGALTRSPARSFAGTETPSGALARTLGRGASGTMTGQGDLDSQTNRTLTGTVTSSGAITARSLARTLNGTVTPTGAIARLIARRVEGSLASSGQLIFQEPVEESFAANLTPQGAITNRELHRTLTAGLTSSGALTRSLAHTLAGSVPLSASLARAFARGTVGFLPPSGNIDVQVNRALFGTLTPVGTLRRQVSRIVGTGTINPFGDLNSAIIPGVPAVPGFAVASLGEGPSAVTTLDPGPSARGELGDGPHVDTTIEPD